MGWGLDDQSWRDSYDDWKLRSPYEETGPISIDYDGNPWESRYEFEEYLEEIEMLDAMYLGEQPELDIYDLEARCGE